MGSANPFEGLKNPFDNDGPQASSASAFADGPNDLGDGIISQGIEGSVPGPGNQVKLDPPSAGPDPFLDFVNPFDSPSAVQAREGPAPEPEIDDRSQFRKGFASGIDKMQGMGGATAMLLGDALGLDGMRDWGMETYQSNMAEAQANAGRVQRIEDISSWGDFGDWLAFTSGETIPDLALGIAGGGVGAFAGKRLAQKKIRDHFEKRLRDKIPVEQIIKETDDIARRAMIRGGAVGGAATTLPMTVGEIGGEIFDETGEIRPGVAASFGAVNAALEQLPIFSALRKFLPPGAEDAVRKSIFRRAVEGGLETAAGEAVTEGLQTIVEKAAVKWVDENKDIFTPENWSEIRNAAAAGAVGGGQVGVITGAISSPTESMARDDVQRRADAYQTALEQEAEAARQRVLDEGGDALTAEIAVQQVYIEGEKFRPQPQNLPTDAEYLNPDAPEGQVLYNPFQQGQVDPTSYSIEGTPVTPAPETFDSVEYTPEEYLPIELEDAPVEPVPTQDFSLIDLKSRAIEDLIEEQSYRDIGLDAADPEPIPYASDDPNPRPAREIFDNAERDAIQADIDRLSAETPKVKLGNDATPSVDHDLLQNIALLGGLSREEAEAQGIDPAEFGRLGAGIRRVFTKNGRSFDDMAESLGELGFFDTRERTPNELLAMLDNALVGGREVSPRSSVQAEYDSTVAQIEQLEGELARLERYRGEDTEEPIPPQDLYDPDDAELRDLSYAYLKGELAGLSDDVLADIINTAVDIRSAIQLIEEEIQLEREVLDNLARQGSPQRGGDQAPSQPQTDAGVDGGEEAGPRQPESQPDLLGGRERTTEELERERRAREEAQRPPVDAGFGPLFDGSLNQLDIADVATQEAPAETAVDTEQPPPAPGLTPSPGLESDGGFTLEQQDATENPGDQPLDLLQGYEPPEDRAAERERIRAKLDGMSQIQLAALLENSNAYRDGLAADQMKDRILALADVAAEMGQYESVNQWSEATPILGRATRNHQALARIWDPRRSRSFSPLSAREKIAANVQTVNGYLPLETEQEKTERETKNAEAVAQGDLERRELEALKQIVEDYMTPERGREIRDWWDGAEPDDRVKLLRLVGATDDEARKMWKRPWVGGDGKLGVSEKFKRAVHDQAVTFWDRFKADPAGFYEGRTLPTDLMMATTLQDYRAISDAVERGVMVPELGMDESFVGEHPAKKLPGYKAAQELYHDDRGRFRGLAPVALSLRLGVPESDAKVLRDYFLNFYERAGMRARPGGEEGPNGVWYEGGQLMALTEEGGGSDGTFVDPKNPDAAAQTGGGLENRPQANREDAIITFGKYRDRNVFDVADEDPDYVRWMISSGAIDKPGLAPFKDELDQKLNAEARAKAEERKKKQAERIKEIDVDAILRAAGLKVKQDGDTWLVSGNTYPVRKLMNELGGRFDYDEKAYRFTDDPRGPIAAELGDEDGTGVDLGQIDPEADEMVKEAREKLRPKLNATPNEALTPKEYRALVGSETKDLIERGRRFGIPDSVVQEQIEDIGMITRASLDGKPVFVLANQAGSGKTFVLGGAMREIGEQQDRRFVYVTMNKNLIAQIEKDLADYGIGDRVEFFTYSALSNKKSAKPVLDENTVLIFDEAHNIKNIGGPSESTRAVIASQMMRDASMTIVSSATPYENPVEMAYLEPTGIFEEAGGHMKFALAYGASLQKVQTGRRADQVDLVAYWPGGRSRVALAAEARDWLDRKGLFTQRIKKLPDGMVESNFRSVEISKEWVERFDTITGAYDEAFNRTGSMILGALKMNTQKRILEAAKLDDGIRMARKAVEDGKQAVIFTETKSERGFTFGISPMEMEQANRIAFAQDEPAPYPSWKVELQREFEDRGLTDYTLPSTVDEIVKAFGRDSTAVYVGAAQFETVNVTDKTAKDDLAAFKAGKLDVMVATMAKGGTGLSIHPTKKNNPRAQIGINLPWKATGVDQVSGRLARYGMQSPVDIDWVFASNIELERKIAGRVGDRMAAMGATVSGLELNAANQLQEWDFESDTDAGGTEDVNRPTRRQAEQEEAPAPPEPVTEEYEDEDGVLYEVTVDMMKQAERLEARLGVLDELIRCLTR